MFFLVRAPSLPLAVLLLQPSLESEIRGVFLSIEKDFKVLEGFGSKSSYTLSGFLKVRETENLNERNFLLFCKGEIGENAFFAQIISI